MADSELPKQRAWLVWAPGRQRAFLATDRESLRSLYGHHNGHRETVLEDFVAEYGFADIEEVTC